MTVPNGRLSIFSVQSFIMDWKKGRKDRANLFSPFFKVVSKFVGLKNKGIMLKHFALQTSNYFYF